MEYRALGSSSFRISVITLGTWAFGNDAWWGYQDDRDSYAVLEYALAHGINCLDTAPVYGRGHSEEVIGRFLEKNNLREKVILATKVGLRWEGRSIFHDLTEARMLAEIDASRKRLQTDTIDLYQVHWPDESVPLARVAGVLYGLRKKNIIKEIGVSNFSEEQLQEFMLHAPVVSLQPCYHMFERKIEQKLVPFCRKHEISILSYAPLHSGILSGKFFLKSSIPRDLNRKYKKDLQEPFFAINKDTCERLTRIAEKHEKTLTQLALAWNISQPGITAAIVGCRTKAQAVENIQSAVWNMEDSDLRDIQKILDERLESVAKLGA